jgi:hypothetical protein
MSTNSVAANAIARQGVVLMFSGGRDSTLAAIRLHNEGWPVTLVTVTSDHLNGIENVEARLRELRSFLPPTTKWIRARQPSELSLPSGFHRQTCLPCHYAYVSIAGAVLATVPSKNIAFGYVGYQRAWPEQTPLAIERLTKVLDRHGIGLLLPVQSLASRDDAIAELRQYGLSTESLEQKCSRQVSNIQLHAAQLEQQIDLWEMAIESALAQSANFQLEVIRETNLQEI